MPRISCIMDVSSYLNLSNTFDIDTPCGVPVEMSPKCLKILSKRIFINIRSFSIAHFNYC